MLGLKNLLKKWKKDKGDDKQPRKQLWNPPHEARRQLSWIDDCVKNHKWCNKIHTREAFLPTRLIDVQKYPDLSLVTTQDLKGEDKRYTALSYCWGTPSREQIVTTKLKLRSHQQAIFLERLPKALRDAIEVTRSLSVPYIWIDVLCIIQDDEADVRLERERVGKVFLQAFVAISNAVSENCDEGFLHDPWLASLPPGNEPRKHSSEQQEYSEKQEYTGRDSYSEAQEYSEKQEYSKKGSFGQQGYSGTREYSEKDLCCGSQEHWESQETLNEKQPFEGSVRKKAAVKSAIGNKSEQTSRNQDWIAALFSSPNFKRRWLWQERELPPRVLHFMPDNVVFECRGERLRYEIPGSYKYAASMPPELRETDQVVGSWQYRHFDMRTSTTYDNWPRINPGFRTLRSSDDDQSITEDGIDKSVWIGQWQNVIKQYSTRHLNDMTENLQALAEVADQSGHHLGCEYIAGIWSASCLLWQRQNVTPSEDISRGTASTKTDYIAPSWTWASVSFPIQFNHSELSLFGMPIMEHTKYIAQYGTSGPLNKKLIRGALQFRAPLKALRSVAPSKSHRDRLRQFYKIKINVGKMDDEMMIAWDTEEEMNSNEEVNICVLMFEGKKEVKIGGGIALRPATRASREYRRVGMASYIPEEWKKDAQVTTITIV